jgi:hypothetical protein
MVINFKEFSKLVTSTIIIFFIFDYIFGYSVFKLIYKNNPEKLYRVENPIYHHGLKKNYKGFGLWFGKEYQICTNEYSFKTDCSIAQNKTNKSFDIGFLGDSFVEGVGVEYLKTFVGLVEKENNLKVANLSAASFSYKIYYLRLKDAIENHNLKFKKLFLFIDGSDLQDEIIYNINAYNYKPNKIKYLIRESLPLSNLLYNSFQKDNFLDNLKKTFNTSEIENLRKVRYKSTYSQNLDPEDIELYRDEIRNLDITLLDIKSLCKEHNIDLTVFTYPDRENYIFKTNTNYNNTSYHERLVEKISIENQIKYVNLNTLFLNVSKQMNFYESDLYIENDNHFSELGHEVMFRIIRNFI